MVGNSRKWLLSTERRKGIPTALKMPCVCRKVCGKYWDSNTVITNLFLLKVKMNSYG